MVKVVITAGGKGLRLFPITKNLPKEMMPIFLKDKNKKNLVPFLHYIFEQLYNLKIRDFYFIVGKDNAITKNYFTINKKFLKNTSSLHKKNLDLFFNKLSNCKIKWIKQSDSKGFGDAIKHAKKYLKNESFIVQAGDTTFISKNTSPITRLKKIAKTNTEASAIILVKKVKNPKRYGIATITKIKNGLFSVTNVEEKPKNPKSCYAIMPIYYFKPIIFKCLNEISPGNGNEYQLTDAIQLLIDKGHSVLAIPILKNDKELDIGTIDSYFDAQTKSFNY
jgi:UTP--glucose-1-phosphate uridylyltransferase